VVDEPSTANGSAAPPYLHIADVLRGEILDGRFRVGERIPSQAELEDRFAVSRPTVQRALKELRKDGYIDNQRGRSAEILDWRRTGRSALAARGEPEPAFAALDAYVAQAFEAEHVTIDSFSLTTETLKAALAQPLLRIQLGELRPASIRVRLLLPTPDARLAVPRMTADPDDERPLRRLRQLIIGHVVSLQSAFNALSDSGLDADIEHSVQIRSVPVTPLFKLYLLNQDTALHGFYRVVPRVVEFGEGENGEIYDVLGISATLFPHRADPADPDATDSVFVEETRSWFESLWSTIAEPLRLFE
jgi:DNA-binding transcriptional regulator YhcF (GntR family)